VASCARAVTRAEFYTQEVSTNFLSAPTTTEPSVRNLSRDVALYSTVTTLADIDSSHQFYYLGSGMSRP